MQGEREMTKQFWCEAMGISLLVFNLGCSQGTPTAPSSLAGNNFGAASDSTASTTYAYPVVTLEPDLHAYPASVTVPVGDKVLFVNNSGLYVSIRSYNCPQFSSMLLQPGTSNHTMPFYTAGKTCNYFVWDYPQKNFEGTVTVR
jgi:plastocyanin